MRKMRPSSSTSRGGDVLWWFGSLALWVVLLAVCCSTPVSADTYELTLDISSDDFDHVTNLTSDNFDEETSDGRVWFVEFYAPWCGHCQRLAPIWKDLAHEVLNESNIGIGRVDATEHTGLASRFDVTSYPALKLLRNKGDLVFDYNGRRSLLTLARWVRSMAREPLVTLKDTAALNTFVTKEGWPAGFVFFGDSDAHPTEHQLIRSEAEKLLNEVMFTSTNKEEIATIYDITPPALVAFHKGQKFASLTAPFTEESIRDFVFYHKLPYFDQIHTNNSDFYIGETAYRRAVIAIVYPSEDSSYQNFLSRVEGISKTHSKLFSFAWIDAGEWFRWMRDVIQDKTEKRRLVVFDGYRSIYYESPKTDLKDPQSIINFITAVHENDLDRVGAVAKGEGLTIIHQVKRISYEFMAEFQKDWKTRKIALLTTFTVSAMTVSTIVFLTFAPRNNNAAKRKTN